MCGMSKAPFTTTVVASVCLGAINASCFCHSSVTLFVHIFMYLFSATCSGLTGEMYPKLKSVE